MATPLDNALQSVDPDGALQGANPGALQSVPPLAPAPNFQDPSGALSNVQPPPVDAFANFMEATGTESFIDAPEVQTFQAPDTPLNQALAGASAVSAQQAGGPTDAMFREQGLPQPTPDPLARALQGPSDLEMLEASGLNRLSPTGGAGAPALVGRAEKRLTLAEKDAREAQLSEFGASELLAQATVNAADTQAESLDRTAKLQATAIEDQAKQDKRIQDNWEAGTKAVQVQLDDLAEQRRDYKNINTGTERSTGQRVLASLAIAFSAFGAAVQRSQGQPAQNLASDILQQQVDNELRRQELELTKAEKEIDFSANALAQTRAIFSDRSDALEGARGHIQELYIAKAEQIATSSSSQAARDQAEIAVATLSQDMKTRERSLAEKKLTQVSASADAARRQSAASAAAGRRSARAELQSFRKLKFKAGQADRDRQLEQQRFEVEQDIKRGAKAQEAQFGKPIPAAEANKKIGLFNNMATQLDVFDRGTLSGMGVVSGLQFDVALAAKNDTQAIKNRLAADELNNLRVVELSGADAPESQFERFSDESGLTGASSVDKAELSLDKNEEYVLNQSINIINADPSKILAANMSLLTRWSSSGRLVPSRQSMVDSRIEQLNQSLSFAAPESLP